MAGDKDTGWMLLLGGAGVLALAYLGRKQISDATDAIVEAVMDKIRVNNVAGAYMGMRPIVDNIQDSAIWNAVRAPFRNGKAERSAAAYNMLIDQFQVATNPRYRKRDSDGNGIIDTFCNIFMGDVLFAMGYVMPWDRATNIARWFAGEGGRDGWQGVTAYDAQNRANAGYPTVAVWENAGGIGHVAVVRPGSVDARLGPTIAQAGDTNFNKGFLGSGFGANRVSLASYFTAE